MQHFHLTLACGHAFHESSVEIHNGEEYKPDYVGREMPARCCSGSHIVTAQKAVHKHGAPLAHELRLQELKLARLEADLAATKAAIEAQEKEHPSSAAAPPPSPELRERFGRLAKLKAKLTRYFTKCQQA